MSVLENLEREWKQKRDPGVGHVLRDIWIERFLNAAPPEPTTEMLQSAALAYVDDQFARLKREVELDVEREVLEELASEQGNFERPWGVHVLTDEFPHGPFRGEGNPRPDYVTPDGLELWIADWGIHGSGKNSQRHFVIDTAPEWVERELREEFGDDAEFVTVYGGGDTEYLADSGGKNPGLWQRVRESGLGEHECPYRTWDPLEREDHSGNKPRTVTDADTWYGNRPGEACRLCDELLGEEHGYLYAGDEPNEVVYVRLVAALPLSEREDDDAERQIDAAFVIFTDARGLEPAETFFERGHWWTRAVDREETEHTFSVVDIGDNGVDFEEV